MKERTLKKVVSMLLAAVVGMTFLGAVPEQVMAKKSNGGNNGISILDALDKETDSATDTSYSLARGNNLNYGTIEISRLSSFKVDIYGLTQAHRTCTTLRLYIYLEQKKNGVYSTYDYWNFSASNAYSLSKSFQVLVPKGYYYRLRGSHAAVYGNTETVTTATNAIWVGNE